MSLLANTRGHKRARATQYCNKVNTDLGNLDLNDKKVLLSQLNRVSVELESLNEKFIEEQWEVKQDTKQLTANLVECEQYESNIMTAISLLNDAILIDVNGSGNSSSLGDANGKRLKLPDAPLPFYSNDKGETLDSFLSTFENVVSKHSLSNYEKFILLKRQLKNEPLILVNSLDTAEQSYVHATDLLRKAFSSEVTRKFDAIKRLSQLKLTYKDSPYEFVGEMRLIQNLFASLKIDSEDVLQFFLWNAMTTNLQSQLVNICNSNKPSLKDINDNIFKAIDRYNEVGDRIKEKKIAKDKYPSTENVAGFAADVNFKPKRNQFCSLCSTNDKRENGHSTKNCPNYTTEELKRRRLEVLNGCVRCGYSNHSVAQCRFKFSRDCLHCQKDHMSYLCITKPKTSKETFKVPEGNKVNSSTVWTTAFNIHVGSEVILPTFTCYINNLKIRCMKDTGCQPNFIKSCVARDLNLHVVHKNYPIVVNGFNDSQSYNTNIVKVPLSIGNTCHEVEAICVPDIRTRLILPGLGKCVKQFICKGYKLADDMLSPHSDQISDLDFMLGTNNPNVLIESQYPYGDSSSSVYSDTNAGTVIFGNLKSILENVKFLPDCFKKYSDDFVISSCVNDSDICVERPVSVSLAILNCDEIDGRELNSAVNEMLQSSLNYDQVSYNEDSTEINERAVNFALNSCKRDANGRLIFRLLWNKEVEHLLGENYNLSKSILFSSMKKIRNDNVKLKLIDDVFQQQVKDGVIEKVENLDNFMAHNKFSFLPHMPIMKPERSTTKVRVVFLSNLCEKITDQITMSHNQVIDAGPCLNQKISIAVTNLRFDPYMITYDLKKAFLQIALEEQDSNRLLFLWYEDVSKGNFNIVAYRNLRLSFGLRASPTILMLAMFKILCIDIENDDQKIKDFKRLLYALLYMDNGAYTGSLDDVKWAYNNLNSVFNPYQFFLQQFTTNVISIQEKVDKGSEEITPIVVKLLGLNWHRDIDKLSATPIELDSKANTKRLILKSIASQFDMQNFQGPLLNRARIYLHNLQCNKDLGWDIKLNKDLLKEWQLIAEQANKSQPILVDRYVGDRVDEYDIIAFSDSSKNIYAVVLYLQNLRTRKVSFLLSKNRLVNKQLELKTIPTLELHAVALGVQMLMDMKEQLSGKSCVSPIKIINLKLFSDSMISLHWINAYGYKLDKMSKLSVFVLNRLENINKLCNSFPVSFNFVDTGSNPADAMTRALSSKMLHKSNYITGPKFLNDSNYMPIFQISLPNPDAHLNDEGMKCDVNIVTEVIDNSENSSPCIDVNKYSSFNKLVRVQALVIKFINLLTTRCKERGKLKHLTVYGEDVNYFDVASKIVLIAEQYLYFSDVFKFYSNYHGKNNISDIPPIINKLNVFVDRDGLIKVKAKMNNGFKYPILLSKDSKVTSLIIRDTHIKLSHSGCYTLLSHLRKTFWVDSFFSTVKKIIKDCVICRRMNNRNVKLNQNEYKDIRINPCPEPFKFIYFDHFGPFTIKYGKERKKIWLLLITCMWSRAINIKICEDLSVKSFLKAFQIHSFENGLPSKAFSDLGTQFSSGTRIMQDYLKEKVYTDFFEENGIRPIEFKQYFKGNSALGSLVEICVKFCKKLIYGAIRNNILSRDDFDFLVAQTVHLVNRRPIVLQHALREGNNVEVPEAITPEQICKGRILTSLNVIPALHEEDEGNIEWAQNPDSKELLRQDFAKLRKVQVSLMSKYNEEFLQNLVCQSVDKNDRYKPVKHHKPVMGDIVLIKDPLMKVYHYPMAIVTKTYENSLDEVTDVEVFKGKTGETVKRHVSCIIPYLRPDPSIARPVDENDVISRNLDRNKRPRRQAKEIAKQRILSAANN